MVDPLLLFDTNVLIYVLNGERRAALAALDTAPLGAISLITWMEVMAGAPATAAPSAVAANKQQRTLDLLDRFPVIPISTEIAARAVAIRQQMRLKLPDAIVYASALCTGRTLVTFNTRDFPAGTPSVYCPENESGS